MIFRNEQQKKGYKELLEGAETLLRVLSIRFPTELEVSDVAMELIRSAQSVKNGTVVVDEQTGKSGIVKVSCSHDHEMEERLSKKQKLASEIYEARMLILDLAAAEDDPLVRLVDPDRSCSKEKAMYHAANIQLCKIFKYGLSVVDQAKIGHFASPVLATGSIFNELATGLHDGRHLASGTQELLPTRIINVVKRTKIFSSGLLEIERFVFRPYGRDLIDLYRLSINGWKDADPEERSEKMQALRIEASKLRMIGNAVREKSRDNFVHLIDCDDDSFESEMLDYVNGFIVDVVNSVALNR